MKLLLHFLSHQPDDFRKGMLFMEGDNNGTEEGENRNERENDLDKIPATKADIAEIKALLTKEKSGRGLSDEERKTLIKLQQKAQEEAQKAQQATNALSSAVDDILNGKPVSVPDEAGETVEKTKEELAAEKEAAEKGTEIVEDAKNEIKEKVAAEITEGEEGPAQEKSNTHDEANAKEADGKTVQAIKDSLESHNENREHDSDLAGYNDRAQFVKDSKNSMYEVADSIEHKDNKILEIRQRESLKETADYETAALSAYNDFMKQFLDKDTRELVKEIDEFRAETFGVLNEYQDKFKEVWEEKNVTQRNRKYEALLQDFNAHIVSLQKGGSRYAKLQSYKHQIVARMQSLFEQKGAKKSVIENKYIQKFLRDIHNEDFLFQKILHTSQLAVKNSDTQNIKGHELFWSGLDTRSNALSMCFNFSDKVSDSEQKVPDGYFQRDVNYLKSDLEETVKGTTYLNERDFWTDREGFKQQFIDQQKNCKKAMTDLSASVENLEKHLNKYWHLSDDDFMVRFQVSRMEASEKLDEMRSNLRTIKNRYATLTDPDYFEKWEKKFKNPETRGDAINDISVFAHFDGDDGIIKKIENKASEINRELEAQGAVYTKVSLYDIYTMFESYFDKREDDWKSRSKLAVATLGEAFTAKDSPINPKFSSELKAAREGEMSECKEALKQLSTSQIKTMYLYTTDDEYMFWACIETLQEREDLQLRDPFVVRTMNRIQPGFFPETDENVEKMSHQDFLDTWYTWVSKISVFQKAKANLWSDAWVADGMVGADKSYASEANRAVENADEFIESVTNDFANFLSGDPKKVAGVDKGYTLAFMRRALGRRKMNGGIEGDYVLWLLLQGLAIGFFTPADIDKIESENKGQFPLLSFLKDARAYKKNGKIVDPDLEPGAEKRVWDVQDYRVWAQMLNGGKMPRNAEDFKFNSDTKKQAYKEFYFQYICNSSEFDASFYNGFVPSIKKADWSDQSLWATKYNYTNAGALLQSTSDATEKMPREGWAEIMKGYPVAVKELWRQYLLEKEKYGNTNKWEEIRAKRLEHLREVMRVGLVFSEVLVGNCASIGSRDNLVTLAPSDLQSGSDHMNARDKIHDVIIPFLGSDQSFVKDLLGRKIKTDGAPDGQNKKDYQKAAASAFKTFFEEQSESVFSNERIEKILESKFGSTTTTVLNTKFIDAKVSNASKRMAA